MRALVGFGITLALLAGCSNDEGTGPGADPATPPTVEVTTPTPPVKPTVPTLTVAPVMWNASAANVGKVHAVAELDQITAVFGDTGVTTFRGGAPLASDAGTKAWRSAGIIPAADGMGTWIVGVDAKGRLTRVSSLAEAEDISDRYGLKSERVLDVGSAALPSLLGRAGFLLEGGLAVSDGKNVTRYEGTMGAFAAGSGLVAATTPAGLRVLDLATGKEKDVGLRGVGHVAIGSTGAVVAATDHAVFVLEGDAFRVLFDAGARHIHGLVASGAQMWIAADKELAVIDKGVAAITASAPIAEGSRLFASPSGDVWALSDGALVRFAAAKVATDEAVWTDTVRPIFASVCSNCHSAPGTGRDTANIDLSTYESWAARRAKILQRAVKDTGTPRAMPPPESGFTMSDAQRNAIASWAGQGG